jgi:hypothetical protein
VTRQFSRTELLSRGTKTGAALFVAGSSYGVLAGVARAEGLSDNDLAYLRLLIACELLGVDFYTNAIAAQPFASEGAKQLKLALFNETEHYTSLAAIMTGAGQTPATGADIDFTYPKAAFTSAGSITKLAIDLETLFLGACLGAVDAVQSSALKLPIARMAANQAQHLSVFSELLGRSGFGLSFPSQLTIDAATDALAIYTA